MRKHNGMRPQDIAVLLKLVASGNESMLLTRLSQSLFLSLSEVSESLHRSHAANLIDHSKKRVMRLNLMEFIEHGVRYVFPQTPGYLTRGIPTAHSIPFLQEIFASNINYVWPDPLGEMLGMQVEPFYRNQVEAAKLDPVLYKLLALTDVTRIGQVREIKVAISELKKMILHEPSNEYHPYQSGQ